MKERKPLDDRLKIKLEIAARLREEVYRELEGETFRPPAE
jgi:hypothetical protein